MILRLVVGVVLTAALLSASAPMLSVGAADAADSSVERQLDALGDRLTTMVETNDPTRGPGARHVTELRLPERSLTSAAVTRLRLYGRSGLGMAAWRVGERRTSRTRLSTVPLRVGSSDEDEDGGLILREPGPHRLVFDLRTRDGKTVLTVRRLGPDGGVRDA